MWYFEKNHRKIDRFDTNEGLSTQKLTNCEIRDDMFSYQNCTKSIYLYIQKKMNVIKKLHLLVRTLNMNDDDNEEKVCGISKKIIGKLTDLTQMRVCQLRN